jgi:hypothetical protein
MPYPNGLATALSIGLICAQRYGSFDAISGLNIERIATMITTARNMPVIQTISIAAGSTLPKAE